MDLLEFKAIPKTEGLFMSQDTSESSKNDDANFRNSIHVSHLASRLPPTINSGTIHIVKPDTTSHLYMSGKWIKVCNPIKKPSARPGGHRNSQEDVKASFVFTIVS